MFSEGAKGATSRMVARSERYGECERMVGVLGPGVVRMLSVCSGGNQLEGKKNCAISPNDLIDY